MPDDPTTISRGGTWHAAPEQLRAALVAPVCSVLDELGVIEVAGADAAAFLQSQLTNDVAGQDAAEVRRNGYCTAKGRLLATFDVWRAGDAFLLQLPRELLPAVLKRLSMFVLRSRVKLSDASAAWNTIAVFGPGAADRLRQVGADAVPPMARSLSIEGAHVSRVEASDRIAEAFVLRVAEGAAAAWIDRIGARRVASAVWWWTRVDAAVPTVFAATQEKYVPQMINYEVLGGVNFKKGCYPGQEVVARSQYLGKLRRRMSIATVDAEAAAGDDVFALVPAQTDPLPDAQPVGSVVMAATAPDGGMDLLFEAPVDRLEGPGLALAGGALLRVRPVPYPLVDVTA
jgi:folate-binding protein YgfZ